jgi:hypothetical protein
LLREPMLMMTKERLSDRSSRNSISTIVEPSA